MKKRFVYSLLFGIPGCLTSLPVSLFVFIDFIDFVDTHDIVWVKSMSDGVLFCIPIFLFLGLLTISVVMGYRTGRKLEGEPKLNRKHLWTAGILTLFLFTAIFQWIAGEIRQESDSDRCSKICLRSGFSISITTLNNPERTCYCSDSSGNSITFPLGNIDPATLDIEPIK
jgi:hypothetical protein